MLADHLLSNPFSQSFLLVPNFGASIVDTPGFECLIIVTLLALAILSSTVRFVAHLMTTDIGFVICRLFDFFPVIIV